MKRRIIVLGDQTDHGGVVITGSSEHTMHGRPIARLGDEVACPLHGINRIVEGHPTATIEGIPVAVEHGMTACGSHLIGSIDAEID